MRTIGRMQVDEIYGLAMAVEDKNWQEEDAMLRPPRLKHGLDIGKETGDRDIR